MFMYACIIVYSLQFLVAERLFPGSGMRAVMQKVRDRAQHPCCFSYLSTTQVALGVCVAPLALTTAFTGILFYDGASTAAMQVQCHS